MWLSRLFSRKKQPVKTGHLCECTGSVNLTNMKEVEHFPLAGGYHTAFLVGTCTTCNGFRGFPHDNLKLAIKEGSENGREALRTLGINI